MKILGVSAYYHDSSATIVENGKIIAAAQEERFSRKKHDKDFPEKAIRYCLEEAGIAIGDLDAVVFYDKPFLKFERLLQTLITTAPQSWWKFITVLPKWLKEKLFIKSNLRKLLEEFGEVNWEKTSLLFSKHHLSHAASAFFPTNFEDAAILTIDGVGEWATASISKGTKGDITSLRELSFPHSVGLLYSSFTYFLGFKVNSGEYKMMGLAPYGEENNKRVQWFYDLIIQEIVQVFDDGSIRLNMDYFTYQHSLRMINEKKFEQLFGFPRRKEESRIDDIHCQLALAVQQVTEDIVIKMAKEAKRLTACSKLCLAGGVALNCVANGKLHEAGLFEEIYVQPASGDAGNSLGAALAAYYMHFKAERKIQNTYDNMQWSRLGPSFADKPISRAIDNFGLSYEIMDQEELVHWTAEQLLKGLVVGWFQGKMEFGPRALGGRSILGNPLLAETQSRLNLKVKQRENFRPFAPIMLQEEFEKYFGQKYASPYMLFVHKILEKYRSSGQTKTANLIDQINQKRSVLPAITHVDYSARIQTVSASSDKLLFALLESFKALTGYGVLVNTSFNLRGEPIVCAPKDAIETFLSTEIDILVLGNYVIQREDNMQLLSNYVNKNID